MLGCDTHHDAIVVGGGPAGALTARLLAREGARVVLLEAAPDIRRKVCGEYLCPAGVDLLVDLGLDASAWGRPITGMRIVSAGGTVVRGTFPRQVGRSQSGLALRRHAFEAELLALARASGATVRMGSRVREIRRTHDGWRVALRDGELRARLLVGADGRRSIVARSLGLERPARHDRIALHGHFLAHRPNAHDGEMHLLPDGSYLGVDPTGDYEVNVSLVCSARRVRELGGARAAMRAHVAAAPDYRHRYGDYPPEAPLRAVSPITHRVRSCIGPAAALVGDAAGFVDPLTGEGIYGALVSARALGRALGPAPSWRPTELDAALHDYARARARTLGMKSRLGQVFQWVIHRPRIAEGLGRYLRRDPRRADVFLGTIGNVYGPVEGFMRMLTA